MVEKINLNTFPSELKKVQGDLAIYIGIAETNVNSYQKEFIPLNERNSFYSDKHYDVKSCTVLGLYTRTSIISKHIIGSVTLPYL